MSKPSPEKPQLAKFKEAAKQVETENSEETFDRVLKRVAKPSQSAPKVK